MSRQSRRRKSRDAWEYGGPRRRPFEPWQVVLVVGLPMVVLVWVLIYVQTPSAGRWVQGLFGGGGGTPVVVESEDSTTAREQAAAYVRRYVSIQTETTDERAGVAGEALRLEVRVRLRNGGTETVTGVKARVMVRLVPSMGDWVVQTREPLAEGATLGPGDRRELTVVFEGLRAQSGDEAKIRVELLEPELELKA
ncbi:MAG: hypothetical protein AAF750_04415 [Planctomycetota bacterium]